MTLATLRKVPVLHPRPLLLVAFCGLLAVSCNSAVIPAGVVGPMGVSVRVAEPPNLSLGERSSSPSPAAAPIAEDEEPSPSPSLRLRRTADEGIAIVSPHDPPLAASAPLPPATNVKLGPLEFISQTVNNCGPASIAEVLGFWGVNKSQDEVQSVLRGDGNPYGMTPAGVPGYMQALGMDALLGTAGTQDLMKALLRAGFPVIVNQTVSAAELAFHYRPLQGFDDDKGVFITSDPLQGPNYAIPYVEFDKDWQYTGQRFMVIFPPDKQAELTAALSAGKWDTAFAEGGGQAQPWSTPTNGPAPVTTPQIDSSGKPPANRWYPDKVTVTFKASDPSGFGVAATTYSVDKQPPRLYRGPFGIDGPGKHTLAFYSVNFAGSREKDETAEIDIGQPPSPTPTPQPSASPKPVTSAPSPTLTPVPPVAPAGGYKVCLLYDQDHANNGSAVLALKFQLCDPNNLQRNLSSAQITLTGQVVVMFPGEAKLPSPGPLRFDPAANDYEVDVPPGLRHGTYALYFTAAGDSVQHSLQFKIG